MLIVPIAMLACVQDCLIPWSAIEWFKKPFVYNKLFANECTSSVFQGIGAPELTCLVFGHLVLSHFTNRALGTVLGCSQFTLVSCRVIKSILKFSQAFHGEKI